MTPYFESAEAVIYHADCMQLDDIVTAASVDMVLTDLPYGMTQCKWDTPLDLDRLWLLWKDATRPRSAIALTACQPFTSRLVMSKPQWFRHEWIWEKNAGSNFGSVRYAPMREHESVLIFGALPVRYTPIMQERSAAGLAMVRRAPIEMNTKTTIFGSTMNKNLGSVRRPDLRYPRSVQRFNRERGLHPTQKPVALMSYLINTYTVVGETVLDCCMGSGSTLVAAAQSERRSIGVENDERYCEIAAQRLSQRAA